MAQLNYLMPDAIHSYIQTATVREPEIVRELREQTAKRPDASWSSPPELGQLLGLLVEISGARTILELGTFTGYGALWMALALPAGGKLIAIDVNENAHALARKYWEKAGVANRIELHVGEIGNRLPPLVPDLAGKVDFAFIDADKPGYGAYYDTCIELVRPGGILVFDNVLQCGAVADPDANPSRKHGRIMRTFNDRLRADDRITMSILPVGDGVLVARKK